MLHEVCGWKPGFEYWRMGCVSCAGCFFELLGGVVYFIFGHGKLFELRSSINDDYLFFIFNFSQLVGRIELFQLRGFLVELF